MIKVHETWFWHRRMGHVNFDSLVNINKTQEVCDLSKLSKLDISICTSYQCSKKARVELKTKEYYTYITLDLFHTNICHPIRTQIQRCETHFILFIYDFTRSMWIMLLKEKSYTLKKFKVFKAQVENERDMKIKCLQSDRWKDLTSRELQ